MKYHMSTRSNERTEYLKRLKEAGEAIRNGNAVAESGYLSREPLQRMIRADEFIYQEREKVNGRRK